MTALELAELYFELSNQSNFTEIEKLFAKDATYSSQTTGEYSGVESIITMQREFHNKFSQLHWQVNSVKELEPGLVEFDYDFIAQTQDGERVTSSGIEQVTVSNDKIQHIEIRNK